MHHNFCTHLISAMALVVMVVPAGAATSADMGDGTAADTVQLSLEDLMQVEVTSVSKKPQKLANVAASVHVINTDDIRHSGANSLAEVLRLAPGIDAARVSGNRWAISARGFAELFAEKLLVLVDGRSAFNPAFSGVLWQDFQFPLEDIERIEVIRGPAASIWGSNGMNGVINIISKSAASTQGSAAVIGTGTVEGAYGRARWGGANANGNVFYRFYGSTQRARAQDAMPSLGGGSGQDPYGHEAAGLRVDAYLDGGARWDISADTFSNRSDGMAYVIQTSGTSIQQQTERHRGTTLRARFEQRLEESGNLQFQAAYARTDLNVPYAVRDERSTLDLDMQHRFRLREQHDVMWGLNYRISDDTVSPTPVMYMNTLSRRMNYAGLFVQDEITLAETLRLTLGVRADHNPISGWENQPTARLSWKTQPNHTLWSSVSRTARAPSRVDSGFNRNFAYIEGDLASLRPNILMVLKSNDAQQSEQLKAIEFGLRSQWGSTLSTDVVLYNHRYANLRTNGSFILTPGFPLTVESIEIKNGGSMTLNGAELSADWRFSPNWRLQLAQAWQSVTEVGTVIPDASGTVPESISSLRLSWSPKPGLSVDAWLRHTGARTGVAYNPKIKRNAFSGLDLRVGWTVRKNIELSLTGQNLNQGACDAYTGLPLVSSLLDLIPTCQPRSLTAQLRAEF
ncbi:MAG: hypothetical protein CO105_13845 [Comamonadaceae bacterium CG_4_9_14_3_um_filter_60_33]|nr:MAG: hypothetical protein AUK51_04895 [Comamonadaceae bacterium CG2_30_59_20]PJB41335.1 MAG: hypothetical protein CO105_13845 [Comamonadaceae bacterium CG_4_9_14_3_um_filter_60_33]